MRSSSLRANIATELNTAIPRATQEAMNAEMLLALAKFEMCRLHTVSWPAL